MKIGYFGENFLFPADTFIKGKTDRIQIGILKEGEYENIEK